MILTGKCSRVIMSLIMVLFLSCKTRQIKLLPYQDLHEGDTIYSIILKSGDLISFAGYRATDSLLSDSTVVGFVFEGTGAKFHNGIIDGVVADGSQMSCDVDSVLAVEMYCIESGQLILTLCLVGGIFAILPLVSQHGDELP